MSLRIVAPFRTLARRAAARRRLVLGAAAAFAALLAAGFLIEARARAADRQSFRTPAGGLAAFIDADGNLALRGTVHVVESGPIVPAPEAWAVRSPDGTVQAALDLRDDANGQPIGTLYLRHPIVANGGSGFLDDMVPGSAKWVQYWTAQNLLPPWMLRDANGRVIATVASATSYDGLDWQLFLRGTFHENGEGAPIAPPDNLVARPLIEAVRLDVAAPTSGTVAVTGYRVEMSTTGTEESFSTVPPQNVTWLGPPATTACNCTGLTAGIRYYFRVRSLAEGFAGATASNVASAVPFSRCQQPWPEGWK